MKPLIALAVGSLAGGFARWGLSAGVYGRWGTAFPNGTLAVNLLACLLIGLFQGLAGTKAWFGPESRLLLMTGFCGAFSTFSTLILETDVLLKAGQAGKAGAYLALSLLLGLALFRLGAFAGERL